jgi:hypothetical protein
MRIFSNSIRLNTISGVVQKLRNLLNMGYEVRMEGGDVESMGEMEKCTLNLGRKN